MPKPKIIPNLYFSRNTSKDVWSLTNEAAAVAANNEKNKGREMINMGQGFFSYSPPPFAISEAKRALDVALMNQYAPTRGSQNLLDTLVDYYSPFYKSQLTHANVTVTTGANEGIFACLAGLLNHGDEVIVFEPFFDQYIANIELNGGKVVYVPLKVPEQLHSRVTKGSEWEVDWDILEKSITDNTKALIINTPHNPIGKVFSVDELTKLGNLCVRHNIVIIADEVYEQLYYTGDFPRIATLSPEIAQLTLSVGSAGKLFAATGWRVGWVVSMNEELLSYVSKAHTRICFSSPSPFQEGVSQAFSDAAEVNYFQRMRQDYIKRYDLVTKVFDELGLPYTIAEGSYFLLVDFAKVKIPSDYPFPDEYMHRGRDFRISYWLTNELGVVTIPCTEFYIKEHEGVADTLLRFAVCKDEAFLQRAVERLKLLSAYL